MAQSTVENVFRQKRTFSIPHYQRDYAWNKKNLEDLWEDLKEAHENRGDSQGHFLGTIVLAPNPQNPDVMDIIDGQQRSTTLFLLRYALNQHTSNPEFNNNLFFRKDGEPTLQVAPKNKEFFCKLIEKIGKGSIDSEFEKQCKTKAQLNLFEVTKTILDKIGSIGKDQEKIEAYLNTLDRMIILELEEKDSSKAIRLFQTVNDRGVKLEILDKLKALLILYSNKYCEGVLDEKINERFGKLFEIIEQISTSKAAASIADQHFAEEAETRIFNYHAYYYKDFGHYAHGANEAYFLLKEHIKKIQKEERHKLQQWLDDYSSGLLKFAETFLALIERTKTDMELFKLFFILKIKPLFYPTLVRLEINELLDQEYLRLIAQAEIIFFGLDSERKAKAYSLIGILDKNDFKQMIIDVSRSASETRKYRNLATALETKINNSYKWGDSFHYLFFTYHQDNISLSDCRNILEQDKKLKLFPIEIEHIVPQNATENGSLEQYGFIDATEFDNLKDTFGNLLSLEASLNREASDKTPVGKQSIYERSKIQYNRQLAYQQDFIRFGKDQIIKRNEEVLKWLTEDFFADFL